MEKETEIELEDKRKVIVLQKRLNSGKRNRWIDDFTKAKLFGNQMNAEITSIAVMRESGVMKSIEKVTCNNQEIQFTMNDLQNLDPIEFDKLWSVFEDLMAVDEKKNP